MPFSWYILFFLLQSLISAKCFPTDRYCSIQSVQHDIVTSATNWRCCHLPRAVTWSLGTYICISLCAIPMETLYVFNTVTHTWLKYNISGNWIARLIIWWTDRLSTSFGLLCKSLGLNNLVQIIHWEYRNMFIPLLALLSLRLLFHKATWESMGMKGFLQENSSYLDN
jgi:hypothetical protein